MIMKNSSFSSSEWALVAFFAIIIASLVLIAKVNAHRASVAVCSLKSVECEVTISGAVKNPGTFRVTSGTPLTALMTKVRPLPSADLKSFKGLVEQSCHIQVSDLQSVIVVVEGEIAEPVTLEMAVGGRICDLASRVCFTPKTDKTFFKKRKKLRDGETIWVPKKKELSENR